jgi:hypothetical protein
MSSRFSGSGRSGPISGVPSAPEEATDEVVALICDFVAESPSRFATALGITAIRAKLGTDAAG